MFFLLQKDRKSAWVKLKPFHGTLQEAPLKCGVQFPQLWKIRNRLSSYSINRNQCSQCSKSCNFDTISEGAKTSYCSWHHYITFKRHSLLSQCFKRSLGFKSLWYLRRMSGLYWECARLNAKSWWIDLPMIFFHRSLTPPLLGGVTAVNRGPRRALPRALLGQWAWSELSVHVTADSFAVKSSHCGRPPQEARQKRGREGGSAKEGMCN